MESILNKFGYFKRKKTKKEYKEIQYREPESPEENGKKLKELMVEGNEWARNKSTEDYQLIGMFFTVILMIEHKMLNLLKSIDDTVERKMLGEKIEVFKEFLKKYEPESEDELQGYKLLIQPLNELKKIRNAMAHDITKPVFCYKDLTQVDSYVKKRRPDMYDKFQDCEDERARCLALISTFGFVFSFEIAKLRLVIVH